MSDSIKENKNKVNKHEKKQNQIDLLNIKINDFKEKLTKQVLECNQVYLTSHMDPDYDAIASLGAIGLICKRLKKAPYIVVDQKDYDNLPNDRTEMFEKLKEKFVVINKEDFENNKVENSLLITVDVNKGFMTPLKNNYHDFTNVVIIDHHEEDENTIKTKYKLITKDVSSCSELLYWLLKKYNVSPSDLCYYTFLLTGIKLDTNKGEKNMFPSTDLCISELKLKGADELVASSYFSLDFEEDRKIQRLIDETFWKTLRFAIIVGNNEVYTKEEIAKAADYLLKYTCEAAIVCGKNKDGSYFVSARSNKENVNLPLFMYELNNGGGNMSSASCPPIYIDEDSNQKEKEVLYKRIEDIIYYKKPKVKKEEIE